MRDVYQTAFFEVVRETQESTGLTLPNDIECYVVMLLADHIDKNDFLPKKSFAESYLTIRNINGLLNFNQRKNCSAGGKQLRILIHESKQLQPQGHTIFCGEYRQ